VIAETPLWMNGKLAGARKDLWKFRTFTIFLLRFVRFCVE